MKAFNIPSKLIRLVQTAMEGAEKRVSTSDGESEFWLRNGVGQGNSLSTLLFNIILEVEIAESDLPREGIIYKQFNKCLSYTDSIALMSNT